MLKNSQGRQMDISRKTQNIPLIAWLMVVAGVALSSTSRASTLTIREVQIQGGRSARILLDGVIPRGGVTLEYVRDNVQFSILNSTIYPARILHSEGEGPLAFSKVFAYQYSPNLVRIRFTVDGKAEALKGKIKMALKGKAIEIDFPQAVEGLPAEDSAEKEASLLSKVLGRSVPVEQEVRSVGGNESQSKSASEKAAEKAAEKSTEKVTEKIADKPLDKPMDQKGKVKTPLAGKRAELGQSQASPSPLRSLIAMFLVVGGLGLVLVYVKKAKGGKQAKRNGDSWLSGILSGGKKNQPYIEVLANHALGPKQSITVVRIRDQQFVLGVTQDSVQLITQIDSDESEIDVLDDPKIADSIGKMFGAKVKPAVPVARSTSAISPSASFDTLLKGSSGAGAIVARNAYQSQASGVSKIEEVVGFQPPGTQISPATSGVREQIRKRLQGMNQR
jgi:flagellar biogenesis protein FliO